MSKQNKFKIILFIISISIFKHINGQNQYDNNQQYHFIDNGILRLGIDLNSGGSICYIAESTTKRNLLNHFDKGRFIQQSYYGKDDGSMWSKKKWRWNPVQGGGYKGEGAKIIKAQYQKSSLQLSSIPKHWATGKDINDMIMKQKITIEDSIIYIKYQMVYKGKDIHPAVHQELPAVFVDYALNNLYRYDGNNEWEWDTCQSIIPGWPNESYNISENWVAYVNNNGWGIGFYIPGTKNITAYRFEGDKKTGPNGGACSYFAPIRTFSISDVKEFEYNVYITIGYKNQIRARFYEIHKQQIK